MSSPFHSWLTSVPLAQQKWFVVRQQGRWKVRHDELLCGPYYAKDGAVRTAIEEAQKAGRKGTGAQVFVQATDDEFRLEWTYGLDPYPPRM